MKNLYKSIAAFQQEMPVLIKDTQAFSYKYVDLPGIYEKMMPLLKKHDLGFIQPLKDDGIETIIFHITSGEEIKSFTKIPQEVEMKGQNPFQVQGSAITYYRRYALTSMLGIISDKDNDTNFTKITKPSDDDGLPF